MKKMSNSMIYKIAVSIVFAWFLFIIIFLFIYFPNFTSFFNTIENKTFDFRQTVISKNKSASKDIVILTIDDKSYENLIKEYGEWPIPRHVYANLTEELEKENPKAIVFDFMFVQSLKSSKNSDNMLINTFKKYDNVFTAINFDDHDKETRIPAKLPEGLAVKIDNKSNIDMKQEFLTYQNVRAILQGIMNSTDNVGHININREDDGIIRRFLPFVNYQDNFYSHLALKAANRYLDNDTKMFEIDKKKNLLIKDRKIPLDCHGCAILSWYHDLQQENTTGGFRSYSMYDILNNIKKGKGLKEFNLQGKMIFIGTTTASLFDVKSVPNNKFMPGIVVLTTFVNNVIDNNFIYKLNTFQNGLIAVLLSSLLAVSLFLLDSTILSILVAISFILGYILFTTFCMDMFHIWMPIVIPEFSMAIIFVIIYIYKYIIKSKDLETTYKLATTDVMTDLYNHRYFQEQLAFNISQSQRYNSNFSLILLDIDFFKKFNDTYGHQAGDAVLQQVAKILKTNIRSSDIACRYGGEEMTVILPNAKKEEAILTARKLCKTVASTPFVLNQKTTVNVTISLGVSTYPEDGTTPSEMIECSDQFLYKAKENGRNQVGNDAN